MKTIYKYTFDFTQQHQIIEVPLIEFLTAQIQFRLLSVWAIVDTDLPKRKIKLSVYGTGDTHTDIEDKHYISTIQLNSGMLVFHLFWSYADEN